LGKYWENIFRNKKCDVWGIPINQELMDVNREPDITSEDEKKEEYDG
jgi:hypothetical protein